jgi:hypothetical protein
MGLFSFSLAARWSLSSLDQRDSPANPGTTQRVGNDLPPQQQLCDVDAVAMMSIRARKSGNTIVYTDCAAAERSLSAAGQPLLPCRARVVAEQLPGSSSHRHISLVACSKSLCLLLSSYLLCYLVIAWHPYRGRRSSETFQRCAPESLNTKACQP